MSGIQQMHAHSSAAQSPLDSLTACTLGIVIDVSAKVLALPAVTLSAATGRARAWAARRPWTADWTALQKRGAWVRAGRSAWTPCCCRRQTQLATWALRCGRGPPCHLQGACLIEAYRCLSAGAEGPRARIKIEACCLGQAQAVRTFMVKSFPHASGFTGLEDLCHNDAGQPVVLSEQPSQQGRAIGQGRAGQGRAE